MLWHNTEAEQAKHHCISYQQSGMSRPLKILEDAAEY
jgi:hypothetical protein